MYFRLKGNYILGKLFSSERVKPDPKKYKSLAGLQSTFKFLFSVAKH